MEGLLSHSLGMYDESSLSDAANFFLNALFIIIVIFVISNMWEYWSWLSNDLKRHELSIFADRYKSPVIESALPELAKVDADLLLEVVDHLKITILNLVPGEKVLVVTLDRRWCTKSQKDL